MPDPFADTVALASGWRNLTADETTRATVLLARASRKIRSQRPDIDAQITAGTIDPELVSDIVCAMVKRVMQGPLDLEGVTQQSETKGPFSQAVTFANPTGDLYLTKQERVDLGISGQRAGNVDLIPVSTT